MSAATPHAARLKWQAPRWMRWARFACFGAALAGAAYLVIRFDVVHLAAADDSARPFYDPASSLLVDVWDPLGEGGRHHVSYHMKGETGYRIGSVVAREGQALEVRETARGAELLIDGLPSGLALRPFDDPARCTGAVPQGEVFVISLVPGSDVPDSRTLGTFRRTQIGGRVLMQLPW